nr:hypothetical protein [Candidatus Sigynarchaeota archaeon]
YSSGWFQDVGTDVIAYCRTKCIEKYGRSIYFIGGGGWNKAGVDGVAEWGACFEPQYPKSTGIPCAAVGPGFYNLGSIAGQTPLFKVREPARYRSEWRTAMQDEAVWIHVETWNELHEGTGIAWAQEYGFQWIDVTREMADEFHAMTRCNPYKDISLPALFTAFGALAAMIAIAGLAVRSRRI